MDIVIKILDLINEILILTILITIITQFIIDKIKIHTKFLDHLPEIIYVRQKYHNCLKGRKIIGIFQEHNLNTYMIRLDNYQEINGIKEFELEIIKKFYKKEIDLEW